MGADNERIKLQATFWNGLAIAAGVGGVILPLLEGYRSDAIWYSTVYPVFSDVAYKQLLTMVVGFFVAFLLRMHANTVISRMKDD